MSHVPHLANAFPGSDPSLHMGRLDDLARMLTSGLPASVSCSEVVPRVVPRLGTAAYSGVCGADLPSWTSLVAGLGVLAASRIPAMTTPSAATLVASSEKFPRKRIRGAVMRTACS